MMKAVIRFDAIKKEATVLVDEAFYIPNPDISIVQEEETDS